ncbi:E3 SUMO-protein ligase ZBED1-like [Eupeodes corollae]|uniref:E3 SUMO-protein ligase ZBED1-like n=1 Tax=Eupeodes corollae TaxID=290404 RepID=UPI002491EEBC|nr:E3 SUMO-protein ligase ZBED1-like [Eupeodes corollae]
MEVPSTATSTTSFTTPFIIATTERPSTSSSSCTITTSTSNQTPRLTAQRQQTISSYTKKPISLNYSKQLDEQIVKTMVKQYYPFCMVEDQEFKKFVQMLNPSYQLPSRKTVSNSLIPRLYEETKVKVQDALATASAVCVTTDGRTSNTQQSYIGITVHFIQEQQDTLSLESRLLGCIPYNESHTITNLGNMLSSELNKWNLEEKVCCVVTDNAYNVVGAVKFKKWNHFPCFAYSLNLVVGEGLAIIESKIVKVKNIVAFFKKSSKATVKLASMERELNLPELKLKQYCITRWNSTYEMLNRILIVKSAVLAVLAIENPDLNCLSASDWTILERATNIFKIFHAITEQMSAKKNVTISKTMLMIKAIRSHLNKMSIENNNEIDEFKQVDQFVDDRVAQATFLDPRFKKHRFSNLTAYEKCLKDLKAKALWFPTQTPPADPDTITASTSTNSESSWRQNDAMIWGDFDSHLDLIVSNPNQHAASILEIDKYINETPIRRNDDPLKWWKERKHIYPRLYNLALKRLCIVATSVPCERVFSKAGLTISNRRSSLKPTKAAQCLFLNYNL